ncbi:MAG: methyltransferase domain-containing protein [Candidatus Electryonea clarkiae]|nr:methyltransferase domain-containing protein [Candidatus Electryonea clarkiae]MDP8285350.1 methyltransferase domain-containing protein [Candidatus Electryonea clarkiae]
MNRSSYPLNLIGAGFDCFLAARAVGEEGSVIGVDMTPSMISKACENIEKAGIENVEFRLGEIENIPAADNSFDIVISNCVINLSPAKQKVYDDAFRVLKPGGRLAISDIVALREFPEGLKEQIALYTGCISGASLISEVETMLTKAGFTEISVKPKEESKSFIDDWSKEIAPDLRKLEDYVISASIEAIKP